MCTTSTIYDYGRTNPPWLAPNYPNAVPYVPTLPDLDAHDAIKRFLKLLDAAKNYDEATGQKDCETPEKASFMAEILARLAAIEKKLGIS